MSDPEKSPDIVAPAEGETDMLALANRVADILDLPGEDQPSAFQRLRVEFPAHENMLARMEQAAVLTVRHQEEFEADSQAAEWVGSEDGLKALKRLHQLCKEISPESLQRPTHPKFERRVSHLEQGLAFPAPLEYLYSLIP